MKSTKTKKIVYTVWVVMVVLMLSSFGITTGGKDSAKMGSEGPKLENLRGNAEFYFTPSDDNRVWHIVNRYHTPGSDGQKSYNEAEYIFGSDSVTVVNEYAGIPLQEELDIAMSH